MQSFELVDKSLNGLLLLGGGHCPREDFAPLPFVVLHELVFREQQFHGVRQRATERFRGVAPESVARLMHVGGHRVEEATHRKDALLQVNFSHLVTYEKPTVVRLALAHLVKRGHAVVHGADVSDDLARGYGLLDEESVVQRANKALEHLEASVLIGGWAVVDYESAVCLAHVFQRRVAQPAKGGLHQFVVFLLVG